jgi:hypothetical protein
VLSCAPETTQIPSDHQMSQSLTNKLPTTRVPFLRPLSGGDGE